MKSEPVLPTDAVVSEVPPPQCRASRIRRRLLNLSVLVGLALLLIPTLMPRKVLARKLWGPEAAAGSAARESLAAREQRIQDLVDECRTRLSIPDAVVVSIVEQHPLVVAVERAKNIASTFSLSIEAAFLDGLTADELDAVVAHELGHVWIFTHHPYLQTEELANQIAMRVVSQDTLAAVYEKVWKHTGRTGHVVYLPPAASSGARESR